MGLNFSLDFILLRFRYLVIYVYEKRKMINLKLWRFTIDKI